MNDSDQNNSLYQTPKSELRQPAGFEVPKDIAKKIQIGWIAAVVTGIMTLVMMLLAIETNLLSDIYSIWSSIDIVLIFVLAYGIYKKSRVAATLMFFYFVSAKVLDAFASGQPNGMIITIVFIYFYFQAMLATYQYHKLIKSL